MIEVLEMGAAPVIEKAITPALKPVIEALPHPKGSYGWVWIVLLIVACIIAYILYQKIKEQPEKLELVEESDDE